MGFASSRNAVRPIRRRALGRGENPLHLRVATDLHHALVAGGTDDAAVAGVVVDGVDVGPTAAGADAAGITERQVAFEPFVGSGAVLFPPAFRELERGLAEGFQPFAAIGVEDLLDIQLPTHIAVAVGDPVVAQQVPLGGTAQGVQLEGAVTGNLAHGGNAGALGKIAVSVLAFIGTVLFQGEKRCAPRPYKGDFSRNSK